MRGQHLICAPSCTMSGQHEGEVPDMSQETGSPRTHCMPSGVFLAEEKLGPSTAHTQRLALLSVLLGKCEGCHDLHSRPLMMEFQK